MLIGEGFATLTEVNYGISHNGMYTVTVLRYVISTAVDINVVVFWDVLSCSFVGK